MGAGTLMVGDCLEVLRDHVPDECVDLIVTSPNTVQLGHLVVFLRRFCEGRERNGARRWFPPASG
jgi:hypothetical protein